MILKFTVVLSQVLLSIVEPFSYKFKAANDIYSYSRCVFHIHKDLEGLNPFVSPPGNVEFVYHKNLK